MLWGFGQIHRQHFRASFHSLTRCNLIHPSPTQPHLSPLGHQSRWATATALAVRAKSDAVDVPHCRSVETKSQQSNAVERAREETRPEPPFTVKPVSLPTEVLAAIDVLLNHEMDKDSMLHYLKDLQCSHSILGHLWDQTRARALAENLAETQAPRRALAVLEIAHTLGTMFKQNAYECVGYRLAEGNHWNLVLSLVKLGKKHTGRTTSRLLNWRARALIETSNFRLLEGILQEFKDEGAKPNRRTYHLILSGHIQNRNLEKARVYLKLMNEAGFPADASTHALTISAYRSLGPDSDVQQKAFNVLGQVSEREAAVIINSLIQFSLDADDLAGALRYLSLFDSPKTVRRKRGYAGGVSHPRMVSPDSATFTMLINYMSADRDIPRLSTIIEKMKAFEVQPDGILVAAVVRALCVADDLPAAVSVVAPMCSLKKRSVILLRRLGLQPSKQKTSMESMASGLSPNITAFNALLRGSLKSLGMNGMLLTLRLMHENGLAPDRETISTLVNHVANEEMAKSRTLLRMTRSLTNGTTQPSIQHLNNILKAVSRQEKQWARKNRLIAIQKTPYEPPAGAPPPIQPTLRSLARPVTESLLSRKVRNDRATVSLRIKQATARRDLQGAEEAFRSMLQRGMHANVYHYGALMQAHVTLGRLATAEKIFKSAIEAGMKPNPTMFTILMGARQGRWRDARRAMRLFDSMIAQGIKPDKGAIHAVVKAFYAAGARGVARRVLLDLWSHIGPFPAKLKGVRFAELVRAFRASSTGDQDPGRVAMLPKGLRQRTMLKWKLRKVMAIWRPKQHVRGRGLRIAK